MPLVSPRQHAFVPTLAVLSRRLLCQNANRCHKPLRPYAALDISVAFVLSHFEAARILQLQRHVRERPTVVQGPFSVDIGSRTLDDLLVLQDGIALRVEGAASQPVPVLATWGELKKMSKKGKSGAFECFLDGESSPSKIAGISESTQRTASLYPCVPGKPPTMVLGGFGMHRLKDTDPALDTDAKIRAVGKPFLRGEVLDICTGLGYTATAAAQFRAVERVTTIELDPVVVAIQRRNPWSQELFYNPKINRVEGDATAVVASLPDNRYNVIIHDPPAQALGGELYSTEFYEQLKRVSARGAVLFHYIGNPSSQESGVLYRGVMSRLQKVGFREIRKDFIAYGVTARSR